MADRGVTPNDVSNVLMYPKTTWGDPKNQSRVILGTAVDGRALKVCVVEPIGSDGIEVVKTVIWLDGG